LAAQIKNPSPLGLGPNHPGSSGTVVTLLRAACSVAAQSLCTISASDSAIPCDAMVSDHAVSIALLEPMRYRNHRLYE